MSSNSLYGIRSTRASPPGHARGDEARRGVYGAALAQFDELVAAAETAGPAARPLPLFYALSQAGRAIAAAHAEKTWRLRRHGLSAPGLDAQIPDVEVKRADGDGNRGGYIDSFAGVATATSSELFSPSATIGALWRSLPEASGLLSSCNPKPLGLVPEESHDPHLPAVMRMKLDQQHVYAVLVGFEGPSEELEAYVGERYPSGSCLRLYRPQGLNPIPPHHTQYGSGYLVRWPRNAEGSEELARIAAAVTREEPAWLRPTVGGVAVSPLLTWWALLFGLSMLARYEPVRWVQALDYDSSELAAPLDELLTIGLDRVPELVFEALRREQSGP